MAVEFLDLPPADAVRHFRAKGMHVGFDWRSTAAEAHAVSFTVAKAMRFDILRELHAAVDRAQVEGVPFREFVADLKPRLQRLGWWGRTEIADPATGEPVEVLIGPRRLRTIFDANLASSAAAGQWQRIERAKEAAPFLRYESVLDDRTRPEHRAWDGIVLPADHEFWTTHFPPNGWRCRCTVTQWSAEELADRGWKVTPDRVARRHKKTRRWVNRRTKTGHDVPLGIDPGWEHNPGKTSRPAALAALNREKFGDPAAPPRLAGIALESPISDFGKEFGEYLAHATSKAARLPVAAIDRRRLGALDLPSDSPAVVTLSGGVAMRHRKRFSEELGAEDWARVQQIVDRGSRASPAREEGKRWRRALYVDDETNEKKVWLLVLDKAPSSEEAHLVTYLKARRQYALKGAGGG